MDQITIYTIGHSTLDMADFIARLRAFGVARLVDVRSIPKSRHNPQFNRDELARKIRNTRVGGGQIGNGRMGYIHFPALGGLRHARKDSINAAWRNASFRGYADYMQTPQFSAALARLIAMCRGRLARAVAPKGRSTGVSPVAGTAIAIMCAEAVPWRCHRSLIADALTARNIRVLHIMSPTGPTPPPHPLGQSRGTQGLVSGGQRLSGNRQVTAAKLRNSEIILLLHPNITRILGHQYGAFRTTLCARAARTP